MMIFSKKESPMISPYLQEQAKEILLALGGKDNLTDISACITRLRLELVYLSKVNEERLNNLGSKGNIHAGENQLHIILGKSADEIAKLIRKI
ncbi:hypothetical protein FHQ26_04195 [Testudinibacter sp. TR-2022]|uniref:PTS transporter subunit EIIB n=1 Tax=Testudinibacter sp. TR-2022 TaxID=2585029 RepID=UPI00111AB77B|nr:PTS glucose/sucrose transporter subunit IIB [Testudinibacter sp. TR-2022]TNH03244.1 hypothetical protein FHQ22_08815 [Pasteurellaceae bacterium Phil31]TNH10911.1 hypothetical protein FHQ26_04195 [Testudinibacter sp. TR-2022]TNH12278.1 hypothetical protein FHQ25_00795 [Testudinibacter sp. TR-2022]TNH15016.1 hypothetical protein FIA56_03885 [Testudinibacter sp. TR-2022]TNH20491.1 hypothetical protein FHQ23_01290 [Testudinibacter sp. TR-2022]